MPNMLLSGASDIVVFKSPDGHYYSTPFICMPVASEGYALQVGDSAVSDIDFVRLPSGMLQVVAGERVGKCLSPGGVGLRSFCKRYVFSFCGGAVVSILQRGHSESTELEDADTTKRVLKSVFGQFRLRGKNLRMLASIPQEILARELWAYSKADNEFLDYTEFCKREQIREPDTDTIKPHPETLLFSNLTLFSQEHWRSIAEVMEKAPSCANLHSAKAFSNSAVGAGAITPHIRKASCKLLDAKQPARVCAAFSILIVSVPHDYVKDSMPLMLSDIDGTITKRNIYALFPCAPCMRQEMTSRLRSNNAGVNILITARSFGWRKITESLINHNLDDANSCFFFLPTLTPLGLLPPHSARASIKMLYTLFLIEAATAAGVLSPEKETISGYGNALSDRLAFSLGGILPKHVITYTRHSGPILFKQ